MVHFKNVLEQIAMFVEDWPKLMVFLLSSPPLLHSRLFLGNTTCSMSETNGEVGPLCKRTIPSGTPGDTVHTKVQGFFHPPVQTCVPDREAPFSL